VVRAALLALLLAGPAAAQEAVAELDADLTGDGRMEHAALLDTDRIALQIHDAGGRLMAQSEAIVWRGQPNEGPHLEVNARGSLIVRSSNWGIGRNKWEMAVTVAFRRGRFVVAGLTFGEVDTFAPDDAMSCDVNLLTGRGVITRHGQEKAVRIDTPAPPVESWGEEDVLRICPE